MSLVRRWDPFSSVSNELTWPSTRLGTVLGADWTTLGPAMDMYETDQGVVVQLSLPGVAPEDVNVTVTGDTLTIRGQFKADEGESKRQYLLRERVHGSGEFTRSVMLPRDVQGAKAEASFKNGVLTLTIPRAEESRPRQVRIKTGRS